MNSMNIHNGYVITGRQSLNLEAPHSRYQHINEKFKEKQVEMETNMNRNYPILHNHSVSRLREHHTYESSYDHPNINISSNPIVIYPHQKSIQPLYRIIEEDVNQRNMSKNESHYQSSND
jgi:hypothetical protein